MEQAREQLQSGSAGCRVRQGLGSASPKCGSRVSGRMSVWLPRMAQMHGDEGVLSKTLTLSVRCGILKSCFLSCLGFLL